MRQSKRHFSLLGGLLLTATLAVGCGGSDSSDENTGGSGLEKKKIKVAMLSLVNNAPYYIAVKEKLFEKEGLEVETQPVQQSTLAIPGLKKGDVDVVFGNDATFLIGHDAGAMRIKLVAEGTTLASKNMGVLVMPKSPIKSIADLKGKSVSVHVLNNIQAITLNAIAKANNMDPKTINYKQIIFPQMGAALQKGDVDSIHTVEPFLTEVQKKLGARLVVDGGSQPVTDLPLDGYFATEEWATKNPKTALAFQRAMLKASELAADRKRVEAIVPTYIKQQDPETTKVMTMPSYPTSLNVARIQRLLDVLVEQQLIKSKIDAKTVVVAGTS